ncbi:MAG: hypothetical protein R2719_05420 [Micropruina sp.]
MRLALAFGADPARATELGWAINVLARRRTAGSCARWCRPAIPGCWSVRSSWPTTARAT